MIATRNSWPVSTTYSIICSLAGCGIALNGWQSVQWGWNDSKGMAAIFAGLGIAPLLAAAFGGAVFLITKYAVLLRKNSIRNAMWASPVYFFAIGAILTMSISESITLAGFSIEGFADPRGSLQGCSAIESGQIAPDHSRTGYCSYWSRHCSPVRLVLAALRLCKGSEEGPQYVPGFASVQCAYSQSQRSDGITSSTVLSSGDDRSLPPWAMGITSRTTVSSGTTKARFPRLRVEVGSLCFSSSSPSPFSHAFADTDFILQSQSPARTVMGRSDEALWIHLATSKDKISSKHRPRHSRVRMVTLRPSTPSWRQRRNTRSKDHGSCPRTCGSSSDTRCPTCLLTVLPVRLIA